MSDEKYAEEMEMDVLAGLEKARNQLVEALATVQGALVQQQAIIELQTDGLPSSFDFSRVDELIEAGRLEDAAG